MKGNNFFTPMQHAWCTIFLDLRCGDYKKLEQPLSGIETMVWDLP